MITAGLDSLTPDVSKGIVEAETTGKGRCSKKIFFYISLTMVKTFNSHLSLTTSIILNTSYVFSDADKKPADNLTKLGVMDMDDLFSKTRDI